MFMKEREGRERQREKKEEGRRRRRKVSSVLDLVPTPR